MVHAISRSVLLILRLRLNGTLCGLDAVGRTNYVRQYMLSTCAALSRATHP